VMKLDIWVCQSGAVMTYLCRSDWKLASQGLSQQKAIGFQNIAEKIHFVSNTRKCYLSRFVQQDNILTQHSVLSKCDRQQYKVNVMI